VSGFEGSNTERRLDSKCDRVGVCALGVDRGGDAVARSAEEDSWRDESEDEELFMLGVACVCSREGIGSKQQSIPTTVRIEAILLRDRKRGFCGIISTWETRETEQKQPEPKSTTAPMRGIKT